MADPKLVKTIGIKVPNANIGEYITVKNLTRGGQVSAKLAGTDLSAVVNPAPSLQWQDGDMVQGEIHGRLNGYQRIKIQSGGANIFSLTATADTTTPGVAL